MYVVTPYPNVLYAFDLTKEGYPLRWKYRPGREPERDRHCLLRRREPRRVLRGRQDRLQPARRAHGGGGRRKPAAKLWKTKIADLDLGETTPMAPLVVKDRVIVGPSGGEFGIAAGSRGSTSRPARSSGPATTSAPMPTCWRSPARSSRSTTEGHGARRSRAGRSDAWKHGGAPVWGWLSYDPELDLRVLWHRQPGAVQHRAAPRRQQLDHQRAGAPIRRTGRCAGPTSSRRQTTGTMTRRRR